MEHESIAEGCIKDSASRTAEAERLRVNRHAMLSLPHADDWPCLSQEMFAIPQTEYRPGHYQTEVMHFGTSYKAVEYEWTSWLALSEDWLSRMRWVSATVHLETELRSEE